MGLAKPRRLAVEESCGCCLRCLNGEIFDSVVEAKVLIERWRREYNQVRPHSALGYRAPAPEAILSLPPGSAPLHPGATAYGLT